MAAECKSRRPASRRRAAWRTLALGAAILYPALAPCQPALPDYQIKAGFLYHFTQFIEWPSSGDDLFAICVAGDKAVRASLQELARGKLVGSRPIRVRQIAEPGEASGCHIVFIGASIGANRQRFIAAVHNLSILTVGEQPGFQDQGGMIELFLDDNHIRFDINEQAIRDARLRASSRLLRLARRVEPARPGGAL
jgi:hypothetical protein